MVGLVAHPVEFICTIGDEMKCICLFLIQSSKIYKSELTDSLHTAILGCVLSSYRSAAVYIFQRLMMVAVFYVVITKVSQVLYFKLNKSILIYQENNTSHMNFDCFKKLI